MKAVSHVLNEDQKKLVEANIDLVPFAINKYTASAPLEFDDMCSLGYYALCRAAIKYDNTKSYSFSTYAIKCIVHQVHRELQFLNRQSRGGGKETLSLNMPISIEEAEEGDCFIDILRSNNNVEAEAINNVLFGPIWKLCPVSKELLETGKSEREAVGKFGVCHQRINQLKNKEYIIVRNYILEHEIA